MFPGETFYAEDVLLNKSASKTSTNIGDRVPPQFKGTPAEWLNMTTFFGNGFSGIVQNDQHLLMVGVPGFHGGMFDWLMGAVYAGKTTVGGEDLDKYVRPIEFQACVVCVCVCVCVLSHWVHAAMDEVPDLPSLKCSSHWSLGLCPASVQACVVVTHCTRRSTLLVYTSSSSPSTTIATRTSLALYPLFSALWFVLSSPLSLCSLSHSLSDLVASLLTLSHTLCTLQRSLL
jgi:hypothetical protein